MSTHTPISNLPLQDLTVAQFIAALAAKTPTPGGGSLAALVAALAAAQASMTLQYTLGKPKFAAHESELQALANQLAHATTMLTDLMEQDRAAYQALSPLLKLKAEARLEDPTFAPALLAALHVPNSSAKHVLPSCAAAQAWPIKLIPCSKPISPLPLNLPPPPPRHPV
ncbi:MAG: cyclodeaminase/cyclohydrolase family protein [Phycisphaerales bacterium]|nr:cyclodeaminase/cyclohydrolase family protein [Phycisphaerales bacterium]